MGISRFERAAALGEDDAAADNQSPADFSDERSGIFFSASPDCPLSFSLWGLDFGEYLPRVLSSDGVEAVAGELSRVQAFLRSCYPELTQEGLGRIPAPAVAKAKERYVRRLSDLVELRHEGATIGVLIGAPEDWSSYYVRSFAVTPSYRRPGLLRTFIKDVLFAALRDRGVERVVADTKPTNIAMSRLFTELHFHATGHSLSDRWGALVRYTKFLDADCEATFMASFAGAVPKCAAGGRKENE